MVYTILISIVFIAEIIITISVIQCLLKFDKLILELDANIDKNKTSIKDISILLKKMSTQWIILADDFVTRTKEKTEDMLLRQLSKFLVALLVLSLNFKTIKRIRKSKITKTLVKGFSFLESMV